MAINSINVNNTDSNYTHSIFDISEYTGKSYATLSDVLGDIPDGKKKGGMTVCFVDNNNNYEQYKLIKKTWNSNPQFWQFIESTNNILNINAQSIGIDNLPLSIRFDGKSINNSGNIIDESSYSIRVFDVTNSKKVRITKQIYAHPIGYFCTDYTNILTSKVGNLIAYPDEVPVWLDVPYGANYIAINSVPDYEGNNVYAEVLSDTHLTQIDIEKEVVNITDNINNIIGEFKNLNIVKSFDGTILMKFNNRLTWTNNSQYTTGYTVRIFDVQKYAKIRIDRYIGGGNYIQGAFCTDATSMNEIIYTNIGGVIENQTVYPIWLDVPNNAKYIALNAHTTYEPNNIYAQVLSEPNCSLNELRDMVYDIKGTKPLAIEKIYDNSTINNSGNIQTGVSGYVIRVFNITGYNEVYIDRYIGNLNYCGVFCTDKDDVISTKVGDFVPKQINAPSWIEVPSGALYFAVNSYPTYEPNNIYVQVLENSESLVSINSKLSNLNNKGKSKKAELICCQWNVGQFANGEAVPTIGPSDYNQKVIAWNKEVTNINADIFGMIEYNPVFGKNTNNETVSPDDVIWDNFVNIETFRQSYTSSWYGGNTINTNLRVLNSQKVKYSCFVGVTDSNQMTQKMLDEAFYTLVEIEYFGVSVKVAECGVPFNISTSTDNTYQLMAYNELANTFSSESFVILFGDFECLYQQDYDVFKNKGFTLCNGGEFGWFPTVDNGFNIHADYLDNIIVKGFNVKSVEVSDSDLSDHYPLIATLEIVTQ